MVAYEACPCGDAGCPRTCRCGRSLEQYGLLFVVDGIAHGELCCNALGAANAYGPAARWEAYCRVCVTALGAAGCSACEPWLDPEPSAVLTREWVPS